MLERDDSPEFQYRGDLSKTTLPEILYTIQKFQVPGVIEARREGVVKKVFIREGNVLHASSSDRGDSLGAYLRRTERLSEGDFKVVARERDRTHERFGVLAVKNGFLSPAEVYEAICEQVEEVVWSLFYWDRGSVTFRIGDFKATDQVRIQLPMTQVILEGIKRAPNARELVARLGKKESVFEPCFRAEDLINTALDRDSYQVLQLVDGRRTLKEVCAQGPLSAGENGKRLYAFQVLQWIRQVE